MLGWVVGLWSVNIKILSTIRIQDRCGDTWSERTVLYEIRSLDGIEHNTNPKTNPNPNTDPNPNPELTQILTLFSCFMLFSIFSLAQMCKHHLGGDVHVQQVEGSTNVGSTNGSAKPGWQCSHHYYQNAKKHVSWSAVERNRETVNH